MNTREFLSEDEYQRLKLSGMLFGLHPEFTGNYIEDAELYKNDMCEFDRTVELTASPVYGVIDPDYAVFLTKASCTASMEGYAIAVHGSFTRDLDVIAIPWTSAARSPKNLIAQIEYRTGLKRQAPEATERLHGRLCWSLLFPGFADPRFIDFSVMPPKTKVI